MTNAPTQPAKFFIPYISEHALAMAGVLRGMGLDAEVLPKPNDESMALGLSLCRGRECLPCFICTGGMILKCRELGDDVGHTAFVMPRGPGPCRFGQYNVLQKQILVEQGFPEAQVVSPTSSDSYALFGDNPLTLRKRAFQSVVAVDLLTKVLLEHRPYEIEPGDADALYQRCLDKIVEAGEAGAGARFVEAMAWTARRFADLPVDRAGARPLVSVIGELYLLLNTRANLEIVRAVERAGGEVLQGTFMDYLHFVDWKRKKLALLFGEYANFVKGALSDRYQHRWARRLLEPLKPVLRHHLEAPVRHAVQGLQPYYEPILGTEAVLTMARALDVYPHGVSGFINVLPFSCMPGTVVAAMAPVLRGKMDGVPWLDISYDGQEETNIHTRLQAFMHQARQFHRRVVLPRQTNGRGLRVVPASKGTAVNLSSPSPSRAVTLPYERSANTPRLCRAPLSRGDFFGPARVNSPLERGAERSEAGCVDQLLRGQKTENVTALPAVGRQTEPSPEHEPAIEGLEAPFTRKYIVRGVGLFTTLTVAGLVILFLLTGDSQAIEAVQSLSLGFMGLVFVTAIADLLLGAFRYHIFLRRIKPDTPYGLAVRAQFANRFGAALTPSQTGGGPAFLYIFFRGGIPVPQGLSVLVINFLTTLIFMVVPSVVVAFMLRDRFSHAAASYLIQYGFVAFGAMAVLLIIALLRPDVISRSLGVLTVRLRRRDRRWRVGLVRAFDVLTMSIDQYHSTCLFFIRKTPWLLVQSLILTVLMYLTKFTMAYFVMRGLGVQADYMATVAVLALLHFVLYLAPSPGGSGIAELGTGALMAFLMPTNLLGVFTIAYRFFLMYLPAAVGAFVLMAALRRPPVSTPARAGLHQTMRPAPQPDAL